MRIIIATLHIREYNICNIYSYSRVDNKEPINMVHLDFLKTFNEMPRKRLLNKTQEICGNKVTILVVTRAQGIGGNILMRIG